MDLPRADNPPSPPYAGTMQPDSTLPAMVAFIKRRLVKTAEVGGQRFPALAETAERFNDTSWFWTDDNAKAAELLAEPGLYDADPAYADAALDFVLRMSEGAVIQRRCGPPELRVLSTDPRAFRVETAFFILEGDLSQGLVRHALRFNDGRTVTAAQHTGNMVSVRQGRRDRTLDVEKNITDFAVEADEDQVAVWHSSRVAFPAVPWLRRAAKPLGRLRYTYTIRKDRPGVALRVELQLDPGVALDGCVLTTAVDQLSITHGVEYRGFAVRAAGVDRTVCGVADDRTTLHEGPADYASIAQAGASPGFSYAIHTLLRDGARLATIQARGQKAGLLHWVLHRYRMGAVPVGGAAVVQEERMVTGGGYYDALAHYEAVLRDGAGGGGYDPSMTYDIGAELNAVAAHILFARRGRYREPPAEARLQVMQAWYDRHVQRYFDFIRPGESDDLSRVFTRGIAFVALSLDCMVRATGDARYRAQLDLACSIILRTQKRLPCGRDEHDITFVDTWAGRVPFLDNHASCVLALARAAWHGDPGGTLSQAVREGILGIKLYSGVVDLGAGHTVAADSLATLNTGGHEHADTGFWNFKLGMVLRALRAASHAADAGKLDLDAAARRRLATRQAICLDVLAQSMRWHRDGAGNMDGDMMEVLTARIAGETNSETQPWVALGLVPVVDEAIVALAVP